MISWLILKTLNYISYTLMKNRILNRQRWDLNICCGKTDGGGVNADVVKHAKLPRFLLLKDVYHLPFDNGQFDSILCSHTAEHVSDPRGLFDELSRVGRRVVLVVPPLWDISAALNVLEHKHLFLTFRTEHAALPPYVRLPLSRVIQRRWGQRIKA